MGDIEHYRPTGEVDEAWTREPLTVCARKLSALGYPAEQLADIESQERAGVEAAAVRALAMSSADPTTAREFVYAE